MKKIRVMTKYGLGTVVRTSKKTYGILYTIELDQHHELAWYENCKPHTNQVEENLEFL